MNATYPTQSSCIVNKIGTVYKQHVRKYKTTSELGVLHKLGDGAFGLS